MTKQTTITRKQENKGWKALLDITGQLPQVLLQVSGKYNTVLEDTDGLTVESFLASYGVNRHTAKNGKKMGYTPAELAKGWHDGLSIKNEEGKTMGSMVFKNVPALYIMAEDDDRKYRVYASKEAAEDPEGESINVYKRVQVDPCRWNWPTIRKGLTQSKYYDKESVKADKSVKAWEAVAECWIATYEEHEDENGKTVKVRKAVKVRKEDVIF